MANLLTFVPTVRVRGEIVTEPLRTTVTRVFYERIALKLAPFVLVGYFLLHRGSSVIGGLFSAVMLFLVALVLVPQLGGAGGAIGGGLFRAFGAIVGALWEGLDAIIGPNKAQVPVLVFNVQSVDTSDPKKSETHEEVECSKATCRHRNPAGSSFCVSCGTTLNVEGPKTRSNGPRRYAVRIEGQIIGGEPSVGHRVTIQAFNKQGNLLFLDGRDETTGAAILVRRNADTGKQH